MQPAAHPPAMHSAIEALAGARFFEGVPDEVLKSLAAEAEFIDIVAGQTLFREGDNSSDFYVLRSGAIAILRTQGDGTNARVGDVFAGETVGEMAMLTGEPRVATALALRDSELVRLTRESVGKLVARDSTVALAIARVLARRLAKAQNPRRERGKPRVFTLLPHPDLAPERVKTIADELLDKLRRAGPTAAITREDSARPRAWFQQCEADHLHTLFIADALDDEWNDFCRRQADILLFLADGGATPTPARNWKHAKNGAPGTTQCEIVLLESTEPAPGATQAWIDAANADFAHHVRDAPDIARVARLVGRRATSVVLSGGGARGFAHIGVIDALIDAGIAIDLFGGASMGAIIAAAYAGGWSRDAVRERMRDAFVRGHPLSDPTLPIVALFKGRKVAWLLQQAFGDRRIEDLRLPFFCVTSNLTRAEPQAHRRGLLRHWLQASIAIPGVLPPFVDEGVVHVDGGVIDNLPIDAASALMRGPVIGIDVSGDENFTSPRAGVSVPFWQRLTGARAPGHPTIMETLWRVGTVGSVSTTRRDHETATLIIRPPVASLPLLDWKSFDRAIALGYESTQKLLADKPELLALLKNF